MRHFSYASVRFVLLVVSLIFALTEFGNRHAETGFAVARQSGPPTVLVLNSYHYGFTWTDYEMKGISGVLKADKIPPEILVEYLDAKRCSSAALNACFREMLRVKLTGRSIDVVIVTDNKALETALDMRPFLFPDTPVVFCGFNGNPDPLIAGRKNVTGILEKWNPRGTLDAIASLQPEVNELAVIHDQTESGLGTREDFMDVVRVYGKPYRIRFLTGLRIEEIYRAISELGNGYAVVLLGFNIDRDGKMFDSAATGGLFASHASVPVYTIDETRFNGGVAGGRLLTGEHQGEVAARLALRIINGERADSIPIIQNDPGVFIFSYTALDKFNLDPEKLPPGSVVRDRPESFYFRYKSQVWAVAFVFAALVAFIVILAYNVLRRKRVEEDRKRLVSAIEETDDVFCFSSVDGKVIYMNAAGMRLLGWSPEDVARRRKTLDLIHPEKITLKLRDVMAEELRRTGKWKGECAVLSADGREIPVSQVITMHRGEDGTPRYFSSIMRDISEQKRTEEILRSSEENLRITLNSIGDAVIATDERGMIRRLNPAAEKLTGWTETDAEGRPLSEVFNIVSALNDSMIENPVEKVIRSGTTVFLQDRQSVLICRDGTRRMISDSAAPIRDMNADIVGVVLVFHDMTEEYSIQDQLRQSQRMEIIGQLAGGVAHDFNNILAVILGTAQILKENLGKSPGDLALAEDIVNAAIRASELTRQLLAFSRKGTMQMTEIRLHEIIREVIRLLGRSIDKSIRIHEHLDASSDVITGDPSLIQSAILNLAVNARDAMPSGGNLSFRTELVDFDEKYCRAQGHDISPGTYLQLSVVDTGDGMSEEIRSRLFEPYFTTKPEGKGTGLGLAAVYGCVRSHRGCIVVDSAPGKGSTFRLFFSLRSSDGKDASIASEGIVRGKGTILVVDDEDIVRNMTMKALQAIGYDVVTASDGYEAVSKLKEANGEVGLVILDIMMPVIGGRETFYLMKEAYPDIRVLLCSGFTRHGVTDELLHAGAAGFISKPFRLDELSRKILAAMK